MQDEAAAQLQAEQARLEEAKKLEAVYVSRLNTLDQSNSSLETSLQQAQEAAAESKVQQIAPACGHCKAKQRVFLPVLEQINSRERGELEALAFQAISK